MEYRLEGNWIFSTKGIKHQDWAVYITARTAVLSKVLDIIIPVLKAEMFAFGTVLDAASNYLLNAGSMGALEIGKTFTIYISSAEKVKAFVGLVAPLLQEYLGPQIMDAVRLEKNIYLQTVTRVWNPLEHEMVIDYITPATRNLPFSIPDKYRQQKRRRFYKYYLKLEALRLSPKGGTILASSFKKLSFKAVVLKEGLHNTVEDNWGRDMNDRLLWQQYILKKIDSLVPTARYLDFFELQHNNYLVIEYIDGKMLPIVVDELRKGRGWRHLEKTVQLQLLDYCIQIATIIQCIHSLKLVHWDIQDNNFIVTGSNKVFILDFELTYDQALQQPDPPFLMGTLGYMAPEQAQGATPESSADIYSLGALLPLIILLPFAHSSNNCRGTCVDQKLQCQLLQW